MSDRPVLHASIVSEDVAGMKSQAFGLAERAGLKASFHPVVVRPLWRHVPPPLWGAMAWHAIRPISIPEEDLVISVGGRGGLIGAALTRQGYRTIQIQRPRTAIRNFSLVIANRHDQLSGPNVIVIRTALHRVTPDVLRRAKEEWEPRLAHLPRPLVAVLLGGNNGRYRLGSAEALTLSLSLRDMMRRQGIGLAVTPSRRTGEKQRTVFEETLSETGAWVWDMQGENPYFGLLACADAIMVTTDSVSMISEAAATSAPVFIMPLPGHSKRIEFFIDDMIRLGRVRMFEGGVESWPVTPVDDTARVAAIIKEKFS